MFKNRNSRINDFLIAIVVIIIASFLSLFNFNNEKIVGNAILSDGDSIIIADKKIRLLDMDAPELFQFCGEKTKRYACGQHSKKHLGKLINGQKVVCYSDKKDQYQRFLAICYAGETNLNQQMVIDGWAVSYYGYPLEEDQARREKRGIWSSPFENPRNWRRSNKL
ncbi:thermonuclease family protein [Bartonella tamiae]|uniref:TNase-like domain-containing protein n=1 Tax=Bartonella tamiae Th239 TaxID=1094558 RepID=J1JVZ2_9HYPH|nr:thermonuclease family protein [Bartonella tamiae]EJF88745.1 hypothetical protein ME5_01296 [Bartonella tamiae Th239]EJF95005.1 hypothetical protein MEG_00586 [Bartonella tamiae Th307]